MSAHELPDAAPAAERAPVVYASLDDLFGAGAMPEEDVELPSGRTVRVRGLNRQEFLIASASSARSALELERANLAAALVAPRMTPDQVARWQTTAAAGELVPVVDAVRRLSGMADGAAKSRLPGDGTR